MATERIEGKRVHNALAWLKDSQTMLDIRIAGTDHGCVTVIGALRGLWRKPAFRIDPPAFWAEQEAPEGPLRLRCEYIGKDAVKYRFTAGVLQTGEAEWWAAYPESIDRIQNRRDFRLDFPSGVTLRFSLAERRAVWPVLNFSRGGAYVEVPEGEKDLALLSTEDRLDGIELVFPTREGDPQRVEVQQAEIRRTESTPDQRRTRYAVAFRSVSEKESRRLTRLIYQFQREYLKRRISP